MTDAPLPELALIRLLRDRSETRQQHARAAQRGSEVRVRRGAYVERDAWQGLDQRQQHLLRMIALTQTRSSPPTFSHWSAAVALGLPLFGLPAEAVHVVVPRGQGGRSSGGVIAHASDLQADDRVEAFGLRCTSAERTVVDLAAIAPFPHALAVADHVLRTRWPLRGAVAPDSLSDALYDSWDRAQPLRGHRRALEVIAHADPRSESPLESVSRAAMHSAGLPQPVLQTPFHDRGGLIGYVDFSWPDFGVVGEADGDAKYLDESLRAGRTAEQVVLDEKIREDRLRARGLRVVRWRWTSAREPRTLGRLLSEAGLPLDPRIQWDLRRRL